MRASLRPPTPGANRSMRSSMAAATSTDDVGDSGSRPRTSCSSPGDPVAVEAAPRRREYEEALGEPAAGAGALRGGRLLQRSLRVDGAAPAALLGLPGHGPVERVVNVEQTGVAATDDSMRTAAPSTPLVRVRRTGTRPKGGGTHTLRRLPPPLAERGACANLIWAGDRGLHSAKPHQVWRASAPSRRLRGTDRRGREPAARRGSREVRVPRRAPRPLTAVWRPTLYRPGAIETDAMQQACGCVCSRSSSSAISPSPERRRRTGQIGSRNPVRAAAGWA